MYISLFKSEQCEEPGVGFRIVEGFFSYWNVI